MKLRVLTLSKPYVAAAYRDKIRLMAQDPRFEIGLVCPPQWAGQDFETSDTLGLDPFFCAQVPIRFNGKNHFHYYRGLENVIREFKPHVFNVEEEHYSIVTWQAYRLALKYAARPMFYTWQNIYKKYPAPFRAIEQFVFKHSLAAVVGNGEAGEILRRKGYQGPLECLPQMGVNENLFPVRYRSRDEKDALKMSLGLNPTLPWVLYCGRLVEEKGITTLIEAVARLSHKGQTIGVVILGNGPEAATLQTVAQKLPAAVDIKFVSGVPSDQVPTWMGAADILCLPSLTRSHWKEQFGRVLVEAMASSTVVVGSSSGEIPQVIGDAGLIFPENDPHQLSDCLEVLTTQPQLYESMKTKGLERVKAHYTNQVIAGRLCDLIWDQYRLLNLFIG